MSRRRLAVALLAPIALLSGCLDNGSAPNDAAPRRPISTTTTTEPFPPSEPWTPTPNEIEPELKQAAADTLTALFTYEAAAGTVEAARLRLAGAPAAPEVADGVAALLDPEAQGAADVIYPQMGGFTGTRASAMVVTRLRWRANKVDRSELRTLDVRLVRRSGAWRVEEVASLGGAPPAEQAAQPPAAQRVLDHPNIDLPDSGRWDIANGRVSVRLLEVMASLADEYKIRVAVLSAGHPPQVFGTGRTSNHARGRAVDIWWVDGPVVEQRDPNGPLAPVVLQLLEAGVTELGAPFSLAGPRGASFADLVHQDHLHVGFDAA